MKNWAKQIYETDLTDIKYITLNLILLLFFRLENAFLVEITNYHSKDQRHGTIQDLLCSTIYCTPLALPSYTEYSRKTDEVHENFKLMVYIMHNVVRIV